MKSASLKGLIVISIIASMPIGELFAQFECTFALPDSVASSSIIACTDANEFLDNKYAPNDTLGPFPIQFHVFRKDDQTMGLTGLNDSTIALIFDELRAAFLEDHIKIELSHKIPNAYVDNTKLYYDVGDGWVGLNHISALYDSSDAINVYLVPISSTVL